MLSVHAIAGRPLHLVPRTRAVIMLLTVVDLSSCIACLDYQSWRAVTCCDAFEHSSSIVHTSSVVFVAVRRILLARSFPNDTILFSISVFHFTPSDECVKDVDMLASVWHRVLSGLNGTGIAPALSRM